MDHQFGPFQASERFIAIYGFTGIGKENEGSEIGKAEPVTP